MSRPLTIAFQPFATQWLGHTSRLIAIAQAVRRRAPEARLVFIVEGSSGQLLEAAGFPHISLPHEAAFAGPEWKDWPNDDRDNMLGEMTRTLLDQLQPRLIVYDSRPCAYIAKQTELMKLPTVFIARRTRSDQRSFEWPLMHRAHIDLIIAPHESGDVPVPPEIAEKTHFVGLIARDASTGISQSAPSTGPRVLITGGGGGFPGTVAYYNTALAAVRAARQQVPQLQATLVVGPMFNEWKKLQLVEGVTIMPFDADMGATMSAVDVVICQAGYNTVAELAGLGRPTICIPAPRVADDQFARARTIATQRKGFFVLVDYTVEMLRDQIIACLAIPRGALPTAPPPPGADRAAQLILSLCS